MIEYNNIIIAPEPPIQWSGPGVVSSGGIILGSYISIDTR